MESKVTKHISTDLEQLNEKIKQLLRDPAEAIDNVSINIDAMTLTQLKEFAENGGLGACVSKADVLANTPEELMYLQGERIIVLKHIENDIYMGYCEGVVGNFNAESVHFVELDPRVLESLDADLDFTDNSQYRNSNSSFDTDYRQQKQQQQQVYLRDSFSSKSSDLYYKSKPSFESLNSSHDLMDKRLLQKNNSDPYDTSAFNIDYSDDEDDEDYQDNYVIHNRSFTTSSINHRTQQHLENMDITTTDDDDYSLRSSNDDVASAKYSIEVTNTNNNTTDEYGFLLKSPLTPKRSNKPRKSMKEYRETEIKWLNIVSKLDAGTVKKDAKMKKLVRSGIPASVRSKVWQFLAGSNDYKKPNQFNALLNKPPIKIYEVIERDIARCYPDHIQFLDKNGQGQKDLTTVLRAYSQYNSHLEYCQGMGRLAGLMLMQMSVEDTFWLLVATIDRYMNGYFTPTLSQLRIDAYIIGQLLKDHNPKLAQHLENNDVLPIMYIAQWFLTAFTMTLPWDTVLRVWDAFYFEGIKVFYRISLAIMDLCKDYLLSSCPTNSELLQFLLHIPHEYLESDTLLDTAFKINLSKTDIKKYAKRAGTEDATTSGLPFEYGIKNLQVGNNSSFGFRSIGGKISRKSSNVNFAE